MSQDNIALARQMYALFGQGDIPGVLALFDPHIEWHQAEGNPYQPDGTAWVGPDTVLEKLFKRIGADWENFRVVTESFTGTDQGVLVQGRYTGLFKPTGRPVDVQMAHVLTMKDGRIAAFQQYVDTAALQLATQPMACRVA